VSFSFDPLGRALHRCTRRRRIRTAPAFAAEADFWLNSSLRPRPNLDPPEDPGWTRPQDGKRGRIKEPRPQQSQRFSIRVDHQGGSALIGLSGEFALEAKELFEQAIADLDRVELRSLIVDLSQVTFLDSTALRLLTELWKRFADRGVSVLLEGASNDAMKLFRTIGLDRVLPISPAPQLPVSASDASWPDWNGPARRPAWRGPGIGLPNSSLGAGRGRRGWLP
jgi:anti-anti-sigma factor